MQKANITLDIYSFLRSQDVADYCRQIGHIFNPLEKAIIINRSEKTPMEKMFAWQILIDHYPDMSLHISVPFKIKDSLHEYLRALIVFYRNHIKRFYKKESDAKYSLITPSVNDLLGIENPDVLEQVRTDPKAFFSGKEKKLPHPLAAEYENLNELWEQIRLYWQGKGPSKICIRKERKKKSQFFYFNRNGKLIMIDAIPDRDNGGPGNLRDLFIHIPVPFQKGDIVRMSYNNEPLLLKQVNKATYKKYVSGERIGDCDWHKDGYASVFSLEHGCLIDSDCTSFLYETDNMWYYRKPLQGEYQILDKVKDYWEYDPSSPAGRRFKNLMRYQNAVYAIQEYTAVREECAAEKNELIDYWKKLTE